MKANRYVALSFEDKLKGRWQKVDIIELEKDRTREIYLEAVEFRVVLAEQVLTTEAGSTGSLYLISSDTTQSSDQITTIYQRRWNVECYHKSLKQNVSSSMAPTQTERTQTNHFFAALCGYIKLEMLKEETKTSHFALKIKPYVNALRSAFNTLEKMSPVQFSA